MIRFSKYVTIFLVKIVTLGYNQVCTPKLYFIYIYYFIIIKNWKYILLIKNNMVCDQVFQPTIIKKHSQHRLPTMLQDERNMILRISLWNFSKF